MPYFSRLTIINNRLQPLSNETMSPKLKGERFVYKKYDMNPDETRDGYGYRTDTIPECSEEISDEQRC